METQENETLYTYLATTIKDSKNPQDFFDINCFSMPKQSELKERCKVNFDKYRGNYLILLLIFILMFVILNPVILPLLVGWAIFFFFVNKGEQNIVLKGYVIQKDWVLKGVMACSVVFILCIYWVFVSLLATTSLYVLVVFIHMLLFSAKEEGEPQV